MDNQAAVAEKRSGVTIEKLFTPGKWFVLFCAVFIVIFAWLQWVINTRLQDAAKLVGEDVFTWVWLDQNVVSSAKLTEAKVVKRSETNAEVEVSGQQFISPFDGSKAGSIKSETAPCKARLIFYRSGNNWNLGKVELQ